MIAVLSKASNLSSPGTAAQPSLSSLALTSAAVLEQAGEPTAPLVSDAFRRLLMQAEEVAEPLSPGAHDVPSSFRRTAASWKGWSGGVISPSWNVKEWNALPRTPQAFLDADGIPDEIGPVVTELDATRMPKKAVRLKRHQDVDGPAVEDMDPAVTAFLNPCWLVLPLDVDLPSNANLPDNPAYSLLEARSV